MDPKKTQYFTRREMAARYQVNIATISRWRSRRIIPAIKINSRAVRYNVAECDAALRRWEIAA